MSVWKNGRSFFSGISLLLVTELFWALFIINRKMVVVYNDCIRKGLFEKDAGIELTA